MEESVKPRNKRQHAGSPEHASLHRAVISESRVFHALVGLCATAPRLSAGGGWYSADAVAAEVGLSVGTVHAHLSALTARGVIESGRVRGRKRVVWRAVCA